MRTGSGNGCVAVGFRRVAGAKPAQMRLRKLAIVVLLGAVLIIQAVSLGWSAVEDEQLTGRCWRFPQAKPVLNYRIIAMNTPDVFLNNMAFNKVAMHEAFINTREAISKSDNLIVSHWNTITFSRDCVCLQALRLRLTLQFGRSRR